MQRYMCPKTKLEGDGWALKGAWGFDCMKELKVTAQLKDCWFGFWRAQF